ncbi:MAG: aminotransferase class V-fold PLP-dependent enzyme [Candidatus Lokiarchaeota archaeon]|nr:aminotransferase class V-fold PLP-dependent enzyme [Candidatus Lokiarchaeota archaeon]
MLELESKQYDPYLILEKSVYSALQTYSNIHRGTGHFSMVTTELFEIAREIVLDYLKLSKKEYTVIFCSLRRLKLFEGYFKPDKYRILSSSDINLPLGVNAFIVRKKALISINNFDSGGGIIKYVSPKSVILSDIPERFEAGTPSINNVICFARALQLIKHSDVNNFSPNYDDNFSIKEILYEDNYSGKSGEILIKELRKVWIGHEIRIPTGHGLQSYTNLDNAATTPTFFPIWNIFSKVLKIPFNKRIELLEEVRTICADFLDAPIKDYEIIFTSNTTESINILASLIQKSFIGNFEPVVVNSLLDHHSNELPWRYVPNLSLIRLFVDDDGFLDLGELETILKEYNHTKSHKNKRIFLVSMCGASNVVGSFNDLKEISRITHKYGAQLLVDGAQMVAHRSVSLSKIGIDYFAFSGHKMYAPFGSGVLVIRKNLLQISKKMLEKINSSGEENLVGIATLGKAFLLLKKIGMNIIEQEERKLTRIALNGLTDMSDIEIYGIQDTNDERFLRRGGVISFSLKKVPYNLVARELAEHSGIGVRSGCFCAHLLVKNLIGIHPVRQFFAKLYMMFIPTLGAIYLPGLIRMSLGLQNDENDVKLFLETLEMIKNKKRARIVRFLASTHSGSGFRSHPLVPKQIKTFIRKSIKKVYSIDKANIILNATG